VTTNILTHNGVPSYTTLNITQLNNITYGPIISTPTVGGTGGYYSTGTYTSTGTTYTLSNTYPIGGNGSVSNLPYITTVVPNYNFAYTKQSFNTEWSNPLQHTINIDGEIKYISKVEAEEIIKKYLILEKLSEEFPQIKYERDKLDSLLKLHTDDENNEK
jgi:hypothetical protein